MGDKGVLFDHFRRFVGGKLILIMAEELRVLKAEVEKLKNELSTLQQTSISVQRTSTGESTSKKELGLQSLIQPWGGGEDEDDIESFLQHLERVAETGGWSEPETLLICRSKLTGAAKACIAAHPELLQPTAKFIDYQNILRQRFQRFDTPEQRLLQLNSIAQRPGEEVRSFADRCRKLGEQASPKTSSPEEATWARGHFDRVVMAAFIKGLKPEIRLQLQFEPPATFQDAVSKATRVSQALADDPTTKEVWAVQQRDGRSRTRTPRNDLCYRCQQSGHFARECPGQRAPKPRWERGRTRVADKDFCFVCGSKEHFARACPKRATRAINSCQEKPQNKDPKAGGSTEAPPS